MSLIKQALHTYQQDKEECVTLEELLEWLDLHAELFSQLAVEIEEVEK